MLLLAVFLFHRLPAGYWRDDDPAPLVHALKSPGLAAFYDPLDWRKLSSSNLTPRLASRSRPTYGSRDWRRRPCAYISYCRCG